MPPESWGRPCCKASLLPRPLGGECSALGGCDSVFHSLPPSGTLPLRTHHLSHLTDSKEGLTLLWFPAFWALPYRALTSGA